MLITEKKLRRIIRQELVKKQNLNEGLDIRKIGLALSVMAAMGVTSVKEVDAFPFFKKKPAVEQTSASQLDAKLRKAIILLEQLPEMPLRNDFIKSAEEGLESKDESVKVNCLQTVNLLLKVPVKIPANIAK